jgi:hypothetical protein
MAKPSAFRPGATLAGLITSEGTGCPVLKGEYSGRLLKESRLPYSAHSRCLGGGVSSPFSAACSGSGAPPRTAFLRGAEWAALVGAAPLSMVQSRSFDRKSYYLHCCFAVRRMPQKKRGPGGCIHSHTASGFQPGGEYPGAADPSNCGSGSSASRAPASRFHPGPGAPS